jgi:hypothetical protein
VVGSVPEAIRKRPGVLRRFIRLIWLPKQPAPPDGTPERAAYDARRKPGVVGVVEQILDWLLFLVVR